MSFTTSRQEPTVFKGVFPFYDDKEENLTKKNIHWVLKTTTEKNALSILEKGFLFSPGVIERNNIIVEKNPNGIDELVKKRAELFIPWYHEKKIDFKECVTFYGSANNSFNLHQPNNGVTFLFDLKKLEKKFDIAITNKTMSADTVDMYDPDTFRFSKQETLDVTAFEYCGGALMNGQTEYFFINGKKKSYFDIVELAQKKLPEWQLYRDYGLNQKELNSLIKQCNGRDKEKRQTCLFEVLAYKKPNEKKPGTCVSIWSCCSGIIVQDVKTKKKMEEIIRKDYQSSIPVLIVPRISQKFPTLDFKEYINKSSKLKPNDHTSTSDPKKNNKKNLLCPTKSSLKNILQKPQIGINLFETTQIRYVGMRCEEDWLDIGNPNLTGASQGMQLYDNYQICLEKTRNISDGKIKKKVILAVELPVGKHEVNEMMITRYRLINPEQIHWMKVYNPDDLKTINNFFKKNYDGRWITKQPLTTLEPQPNQNKNFQYRQKHPSYFYKIQSNNKQQNINVPNSTPENPVIKRNSINTNSSPSSSNFNSPTNFFYNGTSSNLQTTDNLQNKSNQNFKFNSNDVINQQTKQPTLNNKSLKRSRSEKENNAPNQANRSPKKNSLFEPIFNNSTNDSKRKKRKIVMSAKGIFKL